MFWASFKFTFNLCPVSRVQRQGFLIGSFSVGKMMPISNITKGKYFQFSVTVICRAFKMFMKV